LRRTSGIVGLTQDLVDQGAVVAVLIHRRTNLSLDDLPRWLNPIVCGWINYYGRFFRSALNPLLRRVNAYVRRWAGRKYTRQRTQTRYGRRLDGLLSRQPDLFAHWRLERSY
jgi:hypothetical protein